jgi:hypothetical protein
METDMSDISTYGGRPMQTPAVWAVLGLWAAGIATLARNDALHADPGSLPLPVAVAVMVPPLIYLAAYRALPGLRAWVQGLDLAWVIGVQCFRVIGVMFVFLWALGRLPTIFALVAGLGDVAVGLSALGVTLATLRRTDGWQRQARALTLFGLLDFVAAFGTATLTAQGFPLQFPGEPLPVMMQQWPLAMVPGFLVPTFIILHLMAWQKLRQDR